MPDWKQQLAGDYYRWLEKETEIAPGDGGWTVISTPFLDMFNDAIEIWIRREGDKILLSDDGDTLQNLETTQGSGFLRDKPRMEFVEAVLRSNGVRLDRESGGLLVEAQESDFPRKMHGLVSAMLEINGMAAARTGDNPAPRALVALDPVGVADNGVRRASATGAEKGAE